MRRRDGVDPIDASTTDGVDPRVTGGGAPESRDVQTGNAVTADTVTGVVVQAGVITGGIHQHAPMRPAPPVPRQLPPCPAGFVGRVKEQAELDAIVDRVADGDGPLLISVLAGAGGIGKTWLALRWAHRHKHRFPDGELFVDLRGFSAAGAAVPPGEAVWGFLTALGVEPDQIPAGVDARVRLYRSLIAGKRMLVVLDNAATDEQVEPLLPGTSGCAVLVTSRRILTGLVSGHGAGPVPLSVLSDDEAHVLLAQRLGAADVRLAAEPVAAADLIRLCGRYPLALTIVATRAQTRRRIPLAEFAAELRDLGVKALDNPTNPAVSLPAVLSLSLRDVTPEQRDVFALLSVAPGPDIGLPAAVSLTGLPLPRVRAAVEALEEASLLERLPAGRYGMHDLIRDYATQIAGRELAEPARRQALRRVVDFYTDTACAAAVILNPHNAPIRLGRLAADVHPHRLDGIDAASAWFDAEHAALLATQRIAVDHGWRRRVWELAASVDDFHYRRGHRHDRHTVWQAAVDATAHLPCSLRHVRALRHLGHVLTNLENPEQAIAHLRHALAVCQEHRYLLEQAHIHRVLAMAWEDGRDPRQAREHATCALTLFAELGESVWHATMLNAAGWLTALLGDYDTARSHCQAALSLHRQHHNLNGEARTLDSLGFVAHHTGHRQHAIEHYHQAVAVYRALGDTSHHAANTRYRLGHSYLALGHHQQARAVWTEALELYQQQGRETDAAQLRRELGMIGSPVQPTIQQPDDSG
ncbi:MAG TPA: tetratricopeptide repeat protein [Kutzneria sp.]|nr:tetratricopeptide repeat protein [Kutzneria sp.]